MSAGVAGRPLVGCDLSITGCWRSSGGRPERPLLTQAVAFKLEAMGVMDEAIEDGVGIGRVAEHGAMPKAAQREAWSAKRGAPERRPNIP